MLLRAMGAVAVEGGALLVASKRGTGKVVLASVLPLHTGQGSTISYCIMCKLGRLNGANPLPLPSFLRSSGDLS